MGVIFIQGALFIQYFRILIYIFITSSLLISFTFVPYIESTFIEGVTYFFIVPVEVVVFIVLLNNFRKGKLIGLLLLVYFLFVMFFTWLSLNVMAWPTYWFASNNEVLYVAGIGSDVNKVGTKSYQLFVLKIDDDTLYSIPITSNLYYMFNEKCQFNGFPVNSNGWWAGNVILENHLIQAISKYCIK